MPPPPGQNPPSPEHFFETINSYQRTAALKAAIELEVFTAAGEGAQSVGELAARCQTSERGMRVLCDYLVIIGFLTKEGGGYRLTPDSAVFLDRRSPAYLGGSVEFLLAPTLMGGFADLASAVRAGGTVLPGGGTVAPENPVWVKFARAMAPMAALPAQLIAERLEVAEAGPLKVLDIAAGHGLYGIAFARANPRAEVVALDWPGVLEVAKENARAAGVAERFRTAEGDAFSVEYGEGYDYVLLTNFLHHFDPPTCERLLRKVHASLAGGGRAVTLEMVPNEDRVSPPIPAAFSLMMLGSTPAGDAYTFAELERMFANAGFARSELHQLPPTIEPIVVSRK
ncbi:MAG TPA: class I SAM-dependent methyltransferase [Pyrinomonadaceae bacterium]|nr:class I SAM-dependent methyltransferase [Pyrinomonadaceae bacterium]